MWREGRQVTGGELQLGEAGEGIDDKVPGAFMWREGRRITGGELLLAEAGERVAKILGLAIHGQAEGGSSHRPASACTTGHYSAKGH